MKDARVYEKEDLRITKTKNALRSSLLDLLKKEPFERVTVKKITEHGQVSKKAFYAHYRDIYDLVADIYINHCSLYANPYRPISKYASQYHACFEYLEATAELMDLLHDNPRYAKKLIEEFNRSPYLTRCIDVSVSFFIDYILDEHKADSNRYLTIDLVARYMVGGWVAVTQKWISEGMPDSVETMSKRMLHLNLHASAVMKNESINPEHLKALHAWHRGCRASDISEV